ncbi:MAG TPA: hypothetical protein VLC28_02990, partial [Flavitalea sp.]|nr:hypothetical protein [Flavitalea sp.]
MITIFNDIQFMLAPYEKGSVTKVGGQGGQVSLISFKDVEIAGRKRSELCFSSLLIQKGYVGFYFMPVYVEPEMKAVLGAELLKTLKGKSCFHIMSRSPVIYAQIGEALKFGYQEWVKKGWI